MFKKMRNLLIFSVIIFTFSIIANAQSDENPQPNVIIVGAKKTAQVVGKGAVTVAGETAKVAWKVTKYAAIEVIEPTANVIVVKATPKVTKFLISQSGTIIKHGTPIAKKLLLTYLKL
jgi:transcription antitermination factor NusG